MKALITSFVLAFALSYTAFAAIDPARLAEMEKCFQAHAKSLDKPSVRQLDVCWRSHGYLMEKTARN